MTDPRHWARLPLVLAALAAFGTSCADDPGLPAISSVSPAQAFTDGPVVLTVGTEGVRPAVNVDLGGGSFGVDMRSLSFALVPEDAQAGQNGRDSRPRVPLDMLKWDGDEGYWVQAPAQIAGGRYALELTDPGRRVTTYDQAFEALGPDPDPPSIDIVSPVPGGMVGAGTIASAQIAVSDGLGQLASVHWETATGEADDCFAASADPTMLPPSSITCQPSFAVPTLLDQDPDTAPFWIRVTASDVARNQATLEVPLNIGKLPRIDSFSGSQGSLGGYQPFVVHGRYFFPGTIALLGGVPIIGSTTGGDLPDAQTIVGWTPPHGRPETVAVEVVSPAGSTTIENMFEYDAPPHPRDIQPRTAPTSGCVSVTIVGNDLGFGVSVYVGTSLDDRQPLYNLRYDVAGNKVVGCVPAGTGTNSIWVYDPIRGDGELGNVFTYQDVAQGTNQPPLDPACQAATCP